TCFYPVPWTDILEVIKSDVFGFTSSGNLIPGKQEENLCVKAYELLKKDFNLGPVKIHLHKIIPTGAGLGGGSSDAAHTLRLLNTIFELQLSQQILMDYASRLGSDCSFFIQDKPMLGTGRGEVLNEITDLPSGNHLVMIKPDIHISTAEAYAGIRPRKPVHSVDFALRQPLTKWKFLLKNDFEETVFEKFPAIKEIKDKLYSMGALYASMSGTGSTVFGIFDKEIDLSEFKNMPNWSGVLTSSVNG
ncbi:MAG: 4-(cytidine 5'-diphospho)-2-C-methyl-D-erythritol kinase, partial [Marivirga sp.]|nr:4-(cytidine 5'-diphospho)-2-C-methyl-D-erythritol kinase [Marivirga sp.]